MNDLARYISNYQNPKCLCKTIHAVRKFVIGLLIETRPYLGEQQRNKVADDLISRAVSQMEKKKLFNENCRKRSSRGKVRSKVLTEESNIVKETLVSLGKLSVKKLGEKKEKNSASMIKTTQKKNINLKEENNKNSKLNYVKRNQESRQSTFVKSAKGMSSIQVKNKQNSEIKDVKDITKLQSNISVNTTEDAANKLSTKSPIEHKKYNTNKDKQVQTEDSLVPNKNEMDATLLRVITNSRMIHKQTQTISDLTGIVILFINF